MELKRFDASFSNLTKLFRKGFYKKPNEFEINVFSKIADFQLQALIITSRLEEDIAEHMTHTKYIFDCVKESKKISHSESVKSIINFSKLLLDLSDFHIYTRMFLDALTVGIQRSLINAGKKECAIGDSLSCLLNENQMKVYKEKIDPIFFGNLEQHLTWVRDLRDSRDGLVHYYHYFVVTTTRKGELGYDEMDRKKVEWGTDTVKGISVEIQTIIDNITNLMEFLYANLPKKTERGKTERLKKR